MDANKIRVLFNNQPKDLVIPLQQEWDFYGQQQAIEQYESTIIEKILPLLNSDTLIIDITTHDQNGSIEANKIFKSKNKNYIECPVMGGPVQAEEGVLGGIIGGSEENFKKAEVFLKAFCKDYFYFGEVGMGTKSKLLNKVDKVIFHKTNLGKGNCIISNTIIIFTIN